MTIISEQIKIIAAGGTIDKVYSTRKGDLIIGEPAASSLLERAGASLKVSIESVLQKDSLQMSEDEREMICQKIVADSARRIVVTHGTDTMTKTAQRLMDLIREQDQARKTVVFTGAMVPASFAYTDATFNLGFAIAAAQLLPPGIYIAMNSQVFEAGSVRKNYDRGCFESANESV